MPISLSPSPLGFGPGPRPWCPLPGEGVPVFPLLLTQKTVTHPPGCSKLKGSIPTANAQFEHIATTPSLWTRRRGRRGYNSSRGASIVG